MTTLICHDGAIDIEPLSYGRSSVRLRSCATRGDYVTSLALEVIEKLSAGGSFDWLLDTMSRHDEDGPLAHVLKRQLFAYVAPRDFAGKRLLDFGCGNGGSTFSMARMLPETEIIGVELDAGKVTLANELRELRHAPNARFLCSPSPSALPGEIGEFDYVMLSAVYEHLLPAERREVMPLIWRTMKPGALLFINQTPHRWFPFEHHSTGLWGINYLPDALAHFCARKFSRLNPRINKSPDWNVHLRGGIRGATEAEVLRSIGGGTVIQPRKGDRAAYWLASCGPAHPGLKRAISVVFRVADRFLGTVPSINLDVVIRKD